MLRENEKNFFQYNKNLSEKEGEERFTDSKGKIREYAHGGKLPADNLEKELHKLQRELNSDRLLTYTKGDTSEEEMARQKERETKHARFNEVLRLLNSGKKTEKESPRKYHGRNLYTNFAGGGNNLSPTRISQAHPGANSGRSIAEIAREINIDWKPVDINARPYLSAMYSLHDIDDNYGMDEGRTVVAYFLSNANKWRGEKAKSIKAELNKMLKSKPTHENDPYARVRNLQFMKHGGTTIDNKKVWIVNISMPGERPGDFSLRKEEIILGPMSDSFDARQAILRKNVTGEWLGNGKVLSVIEKTSINADGGTISGHDTPKEFFNSLLSRNIPDQAKTLIQTEILTDSEIDEIGMGDADFQALLKTVNEKYPSEKPAREIPKSEPVPAPIKANIPEINDKQKLLKLQSNLKYLLEDAEGAEKKKLQKLLINIEFLLGE
jgi:hypothetical protein